MLKLFSYLSDAQKAAVKQPQTINVHLTSTNAELHAITHKHALKDAIEQLDDKTPIEMLAISGESLWLTTSGSYKGDDFIDQVDLPQKLNPIKNLKIELSQEGEYARCTNDMNGKEFEKILRALPNVENVTIVCSSIENYVDKLNTGLIVDLSMGALNLPKLKSCTFTTFGNRLDGKPRVVDPAIIQCLLTASKDKAAIQQNWIKTDRKHMPTV